MQAISKNIESCFRVDREVADMRVSLQSEASDLMRNPLVAPITRSQAFTRLWEISFLGALDHLSFRHQLDKSTRSRAEHSLHVAALASFIAKKRNYSKELEQHLVAAGLLHDIGHSPLSHSVEPYLMRRFGYGHHHIGEMLINGNIACGEELHNTLVGKLDIAFIKALIAGKVADTDGGDLFSSPFNIDTIEGICRSQRYLKRQDTTLDPIAVAYAAFIDTSEERYAWLDAFWQQKNTVYNKLILTGAGLLADQYSQHYFDKNDMEEADLFATETDWKNKYQELFDNLNSISSKKDIPASMAGCTFDYVKREYRIRSGKVGKERYQCRKKPASACVVL